MNRFEGTATDRATFQPKVGWQEGTAWGICLGAGYILLAGIPVAFALVAKQGAYGPVLVELGLAAALLGFALLCLQIVLASRFHWLDRPFGLDRVLWVHKGVALVAAALFVSHPLLLSLGVGNWHLLALDTPWQVWLGKVALAALVFGVGYALAVRLWRLQYQTWRRLHKYIFVHSILIGDDLERPALLAYWSALFGVAVLIFLWRNGGASTWCQRRFRVVDVRPASHDTYTIRLEPTDERELPARNPGAFMFLRLQRPGRPSEEHPFTISASPTEAEAPVATIKQSGDFTDTIDQTRPGDEALVEYPFGRFSYVHHDGEGFVFIAGGVGITPIRSMLRCLADSGDARTAVLIYGNKAERDILFRHELSELPDNVRVVHVLSEPEDGWEGETGYVTRDIIERNAGEFLGSADVYLCGPPPMMKMVKRALRELGVSSSRIRQERFSL